MSSIIEISTTGTCALRCDFCPQDQLESAYKGPKNLTPEMFGRCLDNLVPEDAIYFCGYTEPCLNPDIMELIQMALDRGHRTRLYTTGRGLKIAEAEKIAAMPLEQIVLHLADAHGHLSHSDGAVPAIKALANHPHALCMTMGDEPHESLRPVWNKLPKQGGDARPRGQRGSS